LRGLRRYSVVPFFLLSRLGHHPFAAALFRAGFGCANMNAVTSGITAADRSVLKPGTFPTSG